jgi:hypothetical protein
MAPPEYAHNRGAYRLQTAGNLGRHPYRPQGLQRPRANEWWAWEELNFRPHAYQARALTN